MGLTQVYVSIRRMCECLGLAVSSQLQRLRRQAWSTVFEMNTVGADGKDREQSMLLVDHVPMWLATAFLVGSAQRLIVELTTPRFSSQAVAGVGTKGVQAGYKREKTRRFESVPKHC